jgi:hypothetical protein
MSCRTDTSGRSFRAFSGMTSTYNCQNHPTFAPRDRHFLLLRCHRCPTPICEDRKCWPKL